MNCTDKHSAGLTDRYRLEYGENNPILRQPAQEITTITPDIKQLGQDMMDLLPVYDGVGLAGPQIGISQRIIAVTQRKEKTSGNLKLLNTQIMINPTITKSSDKLQTNEEGCLSLPGVYGHVTRPYKVTVTYTDLDGHTHTQKLEGFDAAIVQHEIDHLDGVMFVDKMI